MSRAFPRSPSISRSVGTRSPRVEIVIVCEGRNTEPAYFESCADYYGAGLVRLKVIPGAGVPMTLVAAAIAERDRLLQLRRASKDSFDSCFRVWAIFDRDEHTNVVEALMMAAERRIEVGFSDPCFELWPLLHLTEYGAQDGRHQVQARLKARMPKYDHEDGAIIDFGLIRDDFLKAYPRAERLLEAREAEGCPMGCPSSTIGRLVLKIIQQGKAGQELLAQLPVDR